MNEQDVFVRCALQAVGRNKKLNIEHLRMRLEGAMPKHDAQPTDFDWRLTSFEGARREQLRRWAQLPLETSC